MEERVTITIERYDQLLRAEHDANQLKNLISEAYDSYAGVDRAALLLLYKLYFGNTEVTK